MVSSLGAGAGAGILTSQTVLLTATPTLSSGGDVSTQVDSIAHILTFLSSWACMVLLVPVLANTSLPQCQVGRLTVLTYVGSRVKCR